MTADSISIQASFIGSVSTDDALVGKIPPFNRGDIIRGLTLYFVTGTEETTLPTVTLALYACNSPPKTADEANKGRAIISPAQLPTLFQPTNATYTTFQSKLELTVPLYEQLGPNEAHVALVMSADELASGMSGVAFLHAERGLKPGFE